MAQPKEAQQKPGVSEVSPAEQRGPAPPADASSGQELSDEDLEYVVGGVSAEAHQFLQSGLPDD